MTLALAIAGDVVALAAANRDAEPCGPARYLLDDGSIGTGAATAETIDVGSYVTLGAACGRTDRSRLRASRAGTTRVRARWSACDGLVGTVHLKGRIVEGCSRLVGTIRAKKHRQRIEAVRVDCGDGILEAALPPVPFTAARESLATHALPRWFEDAKFGIMIHWGIFAIPAWAETVLDAAEWLQDLGRLLEPPDFGREWFTHIPYTEWYPNTIRIDGSPAQAYHRATYGADFAYEDFRPLFEDAAQAWAAAPWADLFQEARARYVVLVTKHHDGFALWPSAVAHPRRPGWHAERDFVGELSAAVRSRCMRMGLYYSGGLDWSVQPGPVDSVLSLATTLPLSPEYVAYADGQWRELIARYRPAVLWNDIGYPDGPRALELFAHFYNTVPDGVINDRFTILPAGTHHDYLTPEFNVLADISARKFETVRGMGHGFGYNRTETDADYTPAAALIHQLVDIVSKNGNLLLNVGPRADGSIPEEQASRLRAIGRWLEVNGEAIFGTRPWTRAEGLTGDGAAVRFTASRDGRTVYAVVLAPPAGDSVTLAGFADRPRRVRLLGSSRRLRWRNEAAGLVIELPAGLDEELPAYTVALEL